MFKLIEFLKKKPSDMTIRSLRAVLSLAMAALLVFANREFILPMQEYYAAYAEWIVYGIALVFIAHAGVFGVMGMCVYQRKTMKKMQMIAGLAMIVLGSAISYEAPVAVVTANETVQLSDVAKTASSPVHVGGWLIFYGVFALAAGISGKMVTESCSKYKEVITKIRV
jgi:hypothetical protein